MNKSSTKNGNKSRSSPHPEVTKKRRQRSRKNNPRTVGGFPVLSVPIAYAQRQNVSKPRITTHGNNMVISRTEIVDTSVTTKQPAGFEVIDRFRMNPGSIKTFPWLSNIAKCYETYRFKKLIFRFISRLPTTSTGIFYLSPDYDAADAQSTSEIVIANNTDAKEAPIYLGLNLSLKVEKMNRLYKAHAIMDDARFSSTTQDKKTIDCAQLFLAGESVLPSGYRLGKLMVEYEVELFEPQQPFIPTDQGGVRVSASNPVANSANATFSTKPVLIKELDGSSLLENDSLNYPSNNIGKFTRDFTGFINSYVGGQGAGLISQIPSISLDNTLLPQGYSSTAGTNTVGYTNYIDAKIGQILSTGSMSSTSPIQFMYSMIGGGKLPF